MKIKLYSLAAAIGFILYSCDDVFPCTYRTCVICGVCQSKKEGEWK